MIFKKLTLKQTYIVSISANEEIIKSLETFVKEQGIASGYIIGVGSVKSVRIAHYTVSAKKFTERKFKKPLEVSNITGIITKDKVHVHITLGNQLFKGYAGHLVRATVAGLCEVMVVQTEEEVGRKYDDTVGLHVVDL